MTCVPIKLFVCILQNVCMLKTFCMYTTFVCMCASCSNLKYLTIEKIKNST